MAVSITPDEVTGFADITRPNFTMNETVSASCQVQSPQVCNVTNVDASLQAPSYEPDLVITPGSTSVSITGNVQDPLLMSLHT